MNDDDWGVREQSHAIIVALQAATSWYTADGQFYCPAWAAAGSVPGFRGGSRVRLAVVRDESCWSQP